MRPVVAAVVSVLLLLGVGWPAFARQTKRIQLQYRVQTRIEGCPNRQAVMNAVASRLGYEPWNSRATTVVRVTVGHHGMLLTARIQRFGKGTPGGGARDYTSSDCVELIERVALYVSVLIDPLSVSRQGPAISLRQPSSRPASRAVHLPPPPPPPRPVPPLQKPAEPEPGPTVHEKTYPVHFSSSIAGHLALGTMPAVTGGLTVQARLRWRSLSIAAEGRIDLPVTVDVGGPSVESMFAAGTLVPCVHYRWLAGCGLITAGTLRASGHNFATDARQTFPFVAGGVRAEFEYPVFSILSLRLFTDLLFPFTYITLQGTGQGDEDLEFWTTPPVSGAFGLAVVGVFL